MGGWEQLVIYSGANKSECFTFITAKIWRGNVRRHSRHYVLLIHIISFGQFYQILEFLATSKHIVIQALLKAHGLIVFRPKSEGATDAPQPLTGSDGPAIRRRSVASLDFSSNRRFFHPWL